MNVLEPLFAEEPIKLEEEYITTNDNIALYFFYKGISLRERHAQ